MSRKHDATPSEPSTVVAAETVRAAVENHAAARPEAVALTSRGVSITYRELNARANRLADQLCLQGVGPEVPVGLLCGRGFEAIVGTLAILKADGVCVPFDPTLPSERLRTMLALAGLRLVVTTEALQRSHPGLDGPTALVRLEGPCPAAPNLQSRLRPENTAQIQFTTGPTGRPRAVLVSHAAAENLIRWQQTTIPCGPDARVLQFAPPGLDSAWPEIAGALSSGATLVLPIAEERSSARALLEVMGAERITRAYLPVATLSQLAEAFGEGPQPLPELRDVVAVYGPLRISSALRGFFSAHPHCRLHAHFGPTETLVALAHRLEGPPETWPAIAPLGLPVKGVRVLVVDAKGKPATAGGTGELWIGGPHLSRGYHRDPVSTRASFVPDPFAIEGSAARMFRTGELVRISANGLIELTPRGGAPRTRTRTSASPRGLGRRTPAFPAPQPARQEAKPPFAAA